MAVYRVFSLCLACLLCAAGILSRLALYYGNTITFISGVAGICLAGGTKTCDGLADLSRLLLYPAITCLGLGIFIGAVWANISWGTYWSWDPKETWALITFMVYAVAIHDTPLTGNAKRFHIFMILAFMSIVMTYFWVNYLLGGMHSYA